MISLLRLLQKVGLSAFFILLLTMIFLAWLWPGLGMKNSPVPLSFLAQWGPSLIFFFYGLKLSPKDLKNGITQWPVHLAVQATTFVVFPLAVLALQSLFGHFGDARLWLGGFYLAVLPSTVSSSVVMVSIAGGNVPAAVFNASLSSLLGVVLTPLWLSLFLSQTTTAIDLGPTILSLGLQVLLPILLGTVLHRWWGTWAHRNKKLLKLSDQFIILMIVYCSFCESFGQHQFDGFSPPLLALLAVLLLCFFLALFFLLDQGARWVKLQRPERITLLFCGSKKSLVQGASMSPVLFPGAGGVILLPLMMYHALQLLAGSLLAQRMGRIPPSPRHEPSASGKSPGKDL